MKVFSKEEASKYVNGLIPSIKNIDDLVAVIQDSKYSNIKESKVFLEEDLNELLRSLKLTLGALYTEDFAKLYLKLDEIPSELRVYFVENLEKKMFLGQDLYEYRLSHSLAEDISIDKVKELISEKLKGFDLDEQKIQKLIDKSLATLSLDTKSIEYLIESNVSKITNDKILKAVNDKLTEMDLQDTDKVEEARVKSIVETRLNEVIITPTDVRDEVRKEFASKGISEELLNTVKNFDNNIQEALSKITISDEQIRKACQGLNLTENQTTEVKALLNDYVKLEALTTKLEELKSTISAETDIKISDKAETLVKSEFLTTELAKYVLSTTLEEKLAAIQSGVSAEDVDSKITAKLENYVKSEFLNTELEKYISKEALETKLSDTKTNILANLENYVSKEFLNTELEKYAKKSEVYTKEEVDQKVAQGGTFDASSYYQKSEVYSKEESLSKDEITTKLSTKADIVNVYNKSEIDEKIQNIHAGTDENKVNELIDTKLNPVKTSLFTETAADAKYELKTDAFTKAKADELYLSKTDKVKLKGQTATSIADTDEIPFRTDENSDLQFIPVSALKVKGSTSSSATKDEISEQLTSRMGSFTLGDGYLIAKALRPYLNNFTVPERIVEKTVRNLTIRFDMVKGSTTSYGAVIDEIRFYRDGEYYYPKYSTKMKKQNDTEVMILSLTKPSNFNEAFMNTNIPDVPEDYQMEDTELKLTITCSGAYSYETYYTPRHAFSPNVFEYQYYMDAASRNTSWINVEVFSKDGKYFDMISFKNGLGKTSRYSDSVTITINNDNEQLLRKTFNTDLNTVDTKENKIITVFKDLVKTLPETEENTVIENLKQYNKQYIDEKVKANELVNKTDLHNELTNNIKTEIDTVLNQSELMTNLDSYISTQLWKKGIPMPTIPSKKPKTLTVIFDNLTSSSTSYGGGLKNIVFEDADGSRYYVQKCSAQNVNKMDFILSKTPNTTPYSTMQSAGIPNNYELQEGEIKGTVEAYASYDYLVQNLMGTVVLSKLDPFAKYTYTFTDFYPKTIKMENSSSSYWNPNLRVTVLGDNNVIAVDEFKNLAQSSRFETVLPDIGSKDLTKIQTILNGEEVKNYINEKVTTDVTTKFNSVNFLSSENLEEKITEKMPEVVKSFADNGGFVKFMKQAFDILGEEWPQEISSKPTDFKFKINNFALGMGGYAILGYVKLTDDNDKPLFLKAVSNSQVINKDIDIILTSNEAEAASGTTVPSIDTATYVLKEGEYKATVKGTNQYNNGSYYWSYYIFNKKGDNYYNYFLANDVNTELTVTVYGFYPKAMSISNGTDSRNSSAFGVKLYSGDTCYLNKKLKGLTGLTETPITLPKF